MYEAGECQDGNLTSLTKSRPIRMQVDCHGVMLQGRLAGGGGGGLCLTPSFRGSDSASCHLGLLLFSAAPESPQRPLHPGGRAEEARAGASNGGGGCGRGGLVRDQAWERSPSLSPIVLIPELSRMAPPNHTG